MLKKIAPILLLSLLFACGAKDKNVHNYWINSYTVPCEAAPEVPCFQFQKEEAMLHGEWETMTSNIVGFDYEPGYLYDLQVRETKLASPAPDGSTIRYELVAIEAKEVDPLLAVNSIWVATTINGNDFSVARGNELPRVEVNIRANSIAGTDGCNFFNGQFEQLTDENLTLGPLAQTKKACLDMPYADAFMQALMSADSYSLSNDQAELSLYQGENEVLSFKRAQ